MLFTCIKRSRNLVSKDADLFPSAIVPGTKATMRNKDPKSVFILHDNTDPLFSINTGSVRDTNPITRAILYSLFCLPHVLVSNTCLSDL